MSSEPIELVERGNSSRLSLIAASICGVVLLALVVVLATSEGQSGLGASPLVGELTPEVVGQTVDGQIFNIEQERGRWVVVNFFATSCVPCIVEHPELIAFDEANSPAGTSSVVSIAFSDSSQNVIDFFAENGGEWDVLAEDTGRHAINFGVAAVPETYLVSPAGIVTTKFTGGITQADLEAEILRLSGG